MKISGANQNLLKDLNKREKKRKIGSYFHYLSLRYMNQKSATIVRSDHLSNNVEEMSRKV